MPLRRLFFLALIPALTLFFFACDDDVTSPEGDVAAPLVSSVFPAPDAVGVPTDAPMTVTFNEPMAAMTPAALAGMVTLSHGTVTTATWTTAKSLAVTHTPWPASTEVTATFATAFADTSGNTLSAQYSYSFTTAAAPAGPSVVSTYPAPGADRIYPGESIDIIFSEAMDPATATGNIALSHGTVTGVNWPLPHILELNHTDWPTSTEVTVTVGAELANPGGEALGADHAFSFTTDSNTAELVEHVPADGDVDVPLNVDVRLEFSREMNEASLDGAVTVAVPDKGLLAYTMMGGGEDWTLEFPADLPASTLVTVTVATTAQDIYGQPMEQEYQFGFTTGAAVDVTPPQLMSTVPDNGASVDASTGTMQFVFDEAIDDDSLTPSLMSGQFTMTMWTTGMEPEWNAERTVITLDLGAPLAAGTTYRVEFDSFADISGNVNNDGFDYEFTVQGDPDYYPVVDGQWYLFAGTESSTSPGKAVEEFFDLEMVEVVGEPGEFLRKDWDDWEAAFTNWDMYTRNSSGILFRGFHESVEESAEGMDIMFSPPIEWMRFPVTAESWQGTSMFSVAEPGGPDRVTFGAEYLSGTYDVLVSDPGGSSPPPAKDGDQPDILWMDCRKAVINYELNDGTTVFSSGVDTLWYAPGAGLVREWSEEEQEGGMIRTSVSDLVWVGDSIPIEHPR